VLDETLSLSDRQIDSMMLMTSGCGFWGRPPAIATGRTRTIGRYQGQSAAVALRFTDVFYLFDGQWKVVASQGTLISSHP